MGLATLYLTRAPLYFAGEEVDPDKAVAIFVGIPYDGTSTYRPGSRFAPKAIREAAANIEFYSLRAGFDLDAEGIYISDLGDISVSSRVEETLKNIQLVVEELSKAWPEKLLVFAGGEHTITYGVVRGLSSRGRTPCIIVFDAHMDLRGEYMGEKYSHACVMRRISENITNNIAYVGVRAFTKEELVYAKEKGFPLITSRDVRLLGVSEVSRRLNAWLKGRSCDEVYVSIDLDVFDPSYAPGVGNPEPEGLEPWTLIDILYKLVLTSKRRLAGFDVVELSPPYDCSGITSVLAAKIIVEIVALYTLSIKGRG